MALCLYFIGITGLVTSYQNIDETCNVTCSECNFFCFDGDYKESPSGTVDLYWATALIGITSLLETSIASLMIICGNFIFIDAEFRWIDSSSCFMSCFWVAGIVFMSFCHFFYYDVSWDVWSGCSCEATTLSMYAFKFVSTANLLLFSIASYAYYVMVLLIVYLFALVVCTPCYFLRIAVRSVRDYRNDPDTEPTEAAETDTSPSPPVISTLTSNNDEIGDENL